MSEIITKKLISWEQFNKEFEVNQNHFGDGDCDVTYNGYKWFINSAMIDYFGKKIKVTRYYGSNKENYTHEGDWLWHELWFEEEFEPIEFLTEEEMMIE